MASKKEFEEAKKKIAERAKEVKKKIALTEKQRKAAQKEADNLNKELEKFISDYSKKTGEKIIMSFISIDSDGHQKRVVNSTDNLNQLDGIIMTSSLCGLMLNNFK